MLLKEKEERQARDDAREATLKAEAVAAEAKSERAASDAKITEEAASEAAYLKLNQPEFIEEAGSMLRSPHRDDFVPLPPRIPIHHPAADPIIEILPPSNPRRTPEIHQPRRNSDRKSVV